VGVAAYGTADKENTENDEVTFTNANLDAAVQGGNIVEIDLLCAKGADALPRNPNAAGPSSVATSSATRRPGIGSALLAYCLARAAMRKKGGRYRYHGALLMTAADPNRSAMGAVARRMGFQSVNVTIPDKTNDKYFALYTANNTSGWVTTAQGSLANLPVICQRGTKCL
jgi:ribosomal protein S18 acetylase RimI-like enzyme